MTTNEIAILKEQIKKVMLGHLSSLGYPKMDKNRIIAELPQMWVKIEEAGLNKEGLSYKGLVHHAYSQFALADFMSMFKGR